MWPNCIFFFFRSGYINPRKQHIRGILWHECKFLPIFIFGFMENFVVVPSPNPIYAFWVCFYVWSVLIIKIIPDLVFKITCSFFPQDVEVPLHLLRYVCLFCGKNGLSLMKDCFEYGTPETLPFLIAHAFITVVSNVSVLWNCFYSWIQC